MLDSTSKRKLIEEAKASRLRRKKSAHISSDVAEQRRLDDQARIQEERYKTIVENVPCAVYMAFPGKTGPTTFMSNKWKDWTGYSPEQLYQDPEAWPKCIHPDDKENAVNAYSGACRDEAPYDLEYRIVHKDTGQVRYVRDQGLLSKDKKGAVIRVDGIVTDITELKKAENELRKHQDHLEELLNERAAELSRVYEVLKLENTERKKTEEALRENESRYGTVVENAGEGIVVVQDAKLQFVNPYVETVFGRTQEEFRSRPFIEFVHPDDRDWVMDIHARRLWGEEVPRVYELRIVDKHGNTKWLENNGSLIEWNGRPATLNFLRDITEHKRVAEELEDRLGFERLVSMISEELVAVQAGQIDSAVEKGLKLVGEYFDVDRVSIGQIVGRMEDARTTHIWLSDEYDAQLNVLARECSYPNVASYLQRNDAFVYGSLDEFPIDWTEEWQFATATGIKAGVIVHLSIGGKFLGAISMNSLRAERIWPDRTTQRLRFVGEIFANVLNRKRAEEKLREKQRFSEKLLDDLLTFVGVLKPCGEVIFMNNTPLNVCGFELADIKGKKFYDVPCWSYSDEARETIKHDIEQCTFGETLAHDIQIQTADGSLMWIEYSMHPIIEENGVVKYLIPEGRDITERRQAEQRMLKNQAQLKSLASQLSRMEERERHRLATVLHDQIGQSLVFSKLKLDELRTSEPSGGLAKALDEVCSRLGQVIQDTRTLTFDLSSPILYELGFEAAVAEWLTDEIREKHGIETEFDDDGRQKPLSDDIRAILFRNVRELLINVVKHAQARKVKVCIRGTDEDICVIIEDDGVGFDPAETRARTAKSDKFGLFSIRERLEQLGGLIEIDSEPGRGSRISMKAPLKCEELTDGKKL